MKHMLVLLPSLYLLCLGLFGLYHRRHNLISMLMAIELMILGVSISFVGFSHMHNDLEGQIFTIFVLTAAAAEAAIGLAIMLVYYKQHGSIFVDDMNNLRG
jgi:NADH-quinone oxidoreductase subunit K